MSGGNYHPAAHTVSQTYFIARYNVFVLCSCPKNISVRVLCDWSFTGLEQCSCFMQNAHVNVFKTVLSVPPQLQKGREACREGHPLPKVPGKYCFSQNY